MSTKGIDVSTHQVTLVSINPDGWLNVSGGYLFYDKSYLTIT